jgi:hypothetical protein
MTTTTDDPGLLLKEPMNRDPESLVDPRSEPRGRYRCDCGHELRVFGVGRHTIYFPVENDRLDDPVMNRSCPACGRTLPGKNAY